MTIIHFLFIVTITLVLCQLVPSLYKMWKDW